MKYVMSDLHGRFDKYIEMLNKISFSDTDELYLLGDICDRGPQAAQIYLDLMKRKNAYCILGNHEKMLLDGLPFSFTTLRQKDTQYVDLDYVMWRACGGGATCASLISVGMEKTAAVYDYIHTFPLYREVEAAGKRFLLVHAGIDNYDAAKSISDYLPEELLWYGFNFDGLYYPDRYDKIIVGHTPTFLLSDAAPVRIFHGKGNVLGIDCGAVFDDADGRLGCLCLNTMEEFYV